MADDADVDGFVNVAQLEEYVESPEAANDDELQGIAAGVPMAQLVAEDLVGAALAKLGRELLTHKDAYMLLRARDSDPRVRQYIPTRHEYARFPKQLCTSHGDGGVHAQGELLE